MTTEDLGPLLLTAATALLIAVAAVRLSTRVGMPSLLVYLAIGLGLGESGLGITFENASLTGVLGYAALVLILAEGGLTTRWATIRNAVAPAAVLATVGSAVSMVVAGAAAWYLLGVSWTYGLMIGAIISSTDAAAVFSVLRSVPLPTRLHGMLEAESGFNDAPIVIAVVTLTSQALGQDSTPWWMLVLLTLFELAVGTAVGLAVGWLGAMGLRRIALPSSGLYPIAVMGLIGLAYGVASQLHGSGFLAVYLAALVMGNVRLPHGAAVRGFALGLGWMAQIGLFVLLGMLASPSRLPSQILPAIALGLALLLLARPLSVIASLSWFRIPWREQAFISWSGLRGAVPIVLATIPWSAGLPGSEVIFDLVFLLVVIFTLVQAPTLPRIARLLRLTPEVATRDLDVESSPLGALDADVIQVEVHSDSRLHGVELFELRLPQRANVTLVIRGPAAFVPDRNTALRHGDQLIIVTAADVRDEAEARLREVSMGGKLVGWRKRPT